MDNLTHDYDFYATSQNFSKKWTDTINSCIPDYSKLMSDIIEKELKIALAPFNAQVEIAFRPYAKLQEHLQKLMDDMHQTIKESFEQSIKSSNIPHVFDNIKLANNYVEISADALEKVSSFIDVPEDKQMKTASPNTKRFTYQDFLLLILYPLLLIIPQMIQSSYYHRMDSLEAQKAQLSNEAYQEQMLQLNTEHNNSIEQIENSINEFLQYLQSSQECELQNQQDSESAASDEQLLDPDSEVSLPHSGDNNESDSFDTPQ